MQAKARKQVSYQEQGVHVLESRMEEDHVMTEMLMNPNYKFQLETRQRLRKYGILSLPNIDNEGYSLKYVKLNADDVEANPVLKKAFEFRRSLEANDELSQQLIKLELEQV